MKQEMVCPCGDIECIPGYPCANKKTRDTRPPKESVTITFHPDPNE